VRLAVLDIGSNTVKLQVIDAYPGAPPLPIFAFREQFRISEHLDDTNALGPVGIKTLVGIIHNACEAANAHGVTDVTGFATAAWRQASNGDDIRRAIRDDTGLAVQALSGQDEARLTFLAARRWYGWSSGPILLLDIGGGSLEVAFGRDEEPALAESLPLGAGRLAATFLHHDPPKKSEIAALRRQARRAIADVSERLRWEGPASRVVATSKTFKQLARLEGAPGRSEDPFVRRSVTRDGIRRWGKRLARMKRKERASQRGISRSRADQIVAGAIAAHSAMRGFGVGDIEICPWALREGVLLRRLDQLRDPEKERDGLLIANATATSLGRDA
jgi:exopolyphosphatase/guanosine-5'-triphosphate,3'-diphosphate pyrophosphatase